MLTQQPLSGDQLPHVYTVATSFFYRQAIRLKVNKREKVLSDHLTTLKDGKGWLFAPNSSRPDNHPVAFNEPRAHPHPTPRSPSPPLSFLTLSSSNPPFLSQWKKKT